MAEAALAPRTGTARGELRVRSVSKAFGSTQALVDVDLTLSPGRVHALLGANGCGKSTLVKVLAGVHAPDRGTVEWTGEGAPSIAFVHQDLGLIGPLSVTENLALASRAGYAMGPAWIDWRRGRLEARATLASFGLDIDPSRPVDDFGPAERTMIAVARALASLPGQGGVLVLDEPTARLPASEADRLVEMLGALRSREVAILYISHRLEEVARLADEITVLRDGRRVFHGEAGASRDELVRLVVGAEVEPVQKARRRRGVEPVLRVEGLSGMRLRDVAFEIGRGEVLGIAGLVGSGRSELARVIFGYQAVLGGRVVLDGHEVTRAGIAERMERGMGYVPQERAAGLFGPSGVGENIVLAEMDSLMAGARLSFARMNAAAEAIVDSMRIRAAGLDAPVRTLSGGNQQKVALGRWLRRELRLLVLDEPTQGIDVGARTQIFRRLREIAVAREVGVLVLDSDLEILADFCDRALTMSAGRLGTAFEGEALTAAALSRAVYGH